MRDGFEVLFVSCRAEIDRKTELIGALTDLQSSKLSYFMELFSTTMVMRVRWLQNIVTLAIQSHTIGRYCLFILEGIRQFCEIYWRWSESQFAPQYHVHRRKQLTSRGSQYCQFTNWTEPPDH